MKLLILMSDTGGGHRSAAEAVCAALDRMEARSTVELLDFFAMCSPFPLNHAGTIYRLWVNHAAPLWGASFHFSNGRRRADLLGRLISLIARRRLEATLQTFQPDILACVHPLSTQLAADACRGLPFVTIVTDLVTAHASWFSREVDVLVAPSEAVGEHARRAGIPPERIRVIGQPVHPRFATVDAERCSTRESLGLAPDRFTALLIGGGEGMGRVAEMARAIDSAGLHLQQIVVCGRNEALRRQLDMMAWQVPTRALGFVRNMPALMHAADVVVTKAGPSTICEALVVGRPLLLTGHVPGQERGNVGYVVEAGAGRLTETPQALTAALYGLVSSEGESYERMLASARELARPSAARDIGQLLLTLASR